MRYFLFIFVVIVLVVAGIAGCRGGRSRKPPLYIFPDMKRQLKLRPQTANSFFANGLSSQLPPPGTIAQSQPLNVGGQAVYPYEDAPVNTGRPAGAGGTTNFVELNPFPVTTGLLARGRQRFTIYCAPCHGALGDGNGMPKKIGAMAVVANLHDKRIVELPDGEIFNTVSNGKNNMQGYAPQVPVEDRWAIIAYLRALQLTRLGSVDDLSPELRANLKK
jgi:mono/diheme cytochrome c family protein